MIRTEDMTEEQWISAVEYVNSNIYNIAGEYDQDAPDKCVELLLDQGLLETSNDPAHSGKATYGDTIFNLVGCKGTKIIRPYIDPLPLILGIKKLIEKKPEDFCKELLYLGRSSRKVRFELDRDGYGVTGMPLVSISVSDQMRVNKLKLYIQQSQIDNVNELDDEDKSLLSKALGDKDEVLTPRQVDYYLKLYSDISYVSSLDAPIDGDNDTGVKRINNLPSPDDGISGILEDADFYDRLSAFETALSGSGNKRKTLRLFTTRMLAYELVYTEHIYNVENYKESQRCLANYPDNVGESGYMLKKDRSDQTDGVYISVDLNKLKGCCETKTIFDALVTCCLFARGLIDMSGKDFNDDEYHKFLVDTYTEAGRDTFGLSAIRRKSAKDDFYVVVCSVFRTYMKN